jgi:hypothetical protein
MRDGLTRLETYTSEIEAEIAKGRLEALGVPVVLEKDNCGGMRPHLDLQAGVKLFVADQDLDKAREILVRQTVATSTGTWICSGCSEEIDGSYDACWKCGRDQE